MYALRDDISPANTAPGCSSIELRFSSLRELVPGICLASATFAAGPGGGEMPKVTLVLRELLGNAIEHGNHNDPRRGVVCRVTRTGPQSVELSVTDEGSGFTADAVDLQFLDAPVDSGRGGLRLVNALSDSLRFELGGRRVVCQVSWNLEERSPDYFQLPSNDNAGKE
jgi:anti-sigma regulatory factor (Ser/Thr protein kinase)